MSLALIVQLYVDGVWTTYPAFTADGWESSIGPDLQSGVQPNSFGLTLDNDDLSMDPSNPASPLYGKIGPNTPARLRIDSTTITTAEASSWKPDATIEHEPGARLGRASVALTAEGLLRRLGRWTDPIRSPMTRHVISYTTSLLGFWPLEDASTASSLAQLGPITAFDGTFSGPVALASDDGAGGTGRLLKLAAATAINGRFAPSSGNGWQFSFVMKLAAIPVGGFLTMMAIVDGAGRSWYWQVDPGGFKVRIEDSDGVLISETVVSFGTGVTPTTYLRYLLKVTVSGGTVSYYFSWYPQDGAYIYSSGGTFASASAPRPVRWRVSSTAHTEGAAYGQVFATSDTALDLLGSFSLQSFDGFLGETTWGRINRLMNEESLTLTVYGDTDRADLMGRQKPGVFLDLLEDAVRTDGGLLYDSINSVGLNFRMRNHIAGTPPVLTLDRLGDVSPPFRKVIDDIRAGNDVTVTNWDGTETRVELTSGRLSTLPPPNGVGRYKESLDVSFLDPAMLQQRGNLQLVVNTLDRPRYPIVTVDLLANPGLRSAITALRPGDLIEVVNVEASPVLLLVMSIARSGNDTRDTATLNCVPGEVYLAGEYDSTDFAYDARTTTLNAGVTSSATTLVFTSTDRNDVWSSTSAFDVVLAGEVIGVPIGGMGAQTGTGPYLQTATGVTRGKNGISKAQLAGAPIHVANPARWI